jgi:hypothetical protein
LDLRTRVLVFLFSSHLSGMSSAESPASAFRDLFAPSFFLSSMHQAVRPSAVQIIIPRILLALSTLAHSFRLGLCQRSHSQVPSGRSYFNSAAILTEFRVDQFHISPHRHPLWIPRIVRRIACGSEGTAMIIEFVTTYTGVWRKILPEVRYRPDLARACGEVINPGVSGFW